MCAARAAVPFIPFLAPGACCAVQRWFRSGRLTNCIDFGGYRSLPTITADNGGYLARRARDEQPETRASDRGAGLTPYSHPANDTSALSYALSRIGTNTDQVATQPRT